MDDRTQPPILGAVDGNDLQKLEIRIRALEQWTNTFDAVNIERRERQEAEFGRVHSRLDRIDGHISKLVWLIVAALVSGLMGFIISGGFSGV